MASRVSFLLLLAVGFTSAALWSYENDGPRVWKDMFPTCGNMKQSPIDIDLSGVRYNPNLTAFVLTGYDAVLPLNVTNNGHSAKVDVDGNVYISNGGLPEKYTLAQYHFHWGSVDTKGSEHTVDRNAFPMEIHFVHHKASLGSLGNAVNEPEGLAVLGFFFEIGDSDNANYADLVSKLHDIADYGGNITEVPLMPRAIRSLMPAKIDNFFRYSGSLTTPPCAESVIWTVFEETIKISSAQMNKFREMYSSEHDANNNHIHLQDNNRPAQALNSRVVESSYKLELESSTSATFLSTCALVMGQIASAVLRN